MLLFYIIKAQSKNELIMANKMQPIKAIEEYKIEKYIYKDYIIIIMRYHWYISFAFLFYIIKIQLKSQALAINII